MLITVKLDLKSLKLGGDTPQNRKDRLQQDRELEANWEMKRARFFNRESRVVR